MLRPLLAFAALACTVALVAPTVGSVHQEIEDLDIHRAMPWDLWKWGKQLEPPTSIIPPQCDDTERQTYSEVTQWPERIRKNETYTMGGIVNVPVEGDRGLDAVRVDLFLNETKELPGEFLGTVLTDGDGNFELTGKFPTELQATKYHLVAHAYEKREGCVLYLEHWSDPEMEVVSQTKLTIEADKLLIVGRDATLVGRLVDSVGGPVRNAEIDLTAGEDYLHVTTDADGNFRHVFRPSEPGSFTISAEFDATEYYEGSADSLEVEVEEEAVVLEGVTAHGVELVRSETRTISGRVYLKEGATPAPLVITLDGVRAVACDGCDATSTFTVEPAPDGNFTLDLFVPSSEPAGEFRMTFTEGGLSRSMAYDGVVWVPVAVTLDATSTSFFSDGFEMRAVAQTDAGSPPPGPLALDAPDAWHTSEPDEAGAVMLASSASCGDHTVRAHYNGTGYYRPALAEQDLTICPYMAFVPAWLIAIPWWGWLLIIFGGLAAYALARHLQTRYATTITRGPPMTLSFTTPDDAAAGIVGMGEAATVTAFLDDPLPDGHKLRLGTFRDMEHVEVGPDLRASLALLPDRLGDITVRGEILDKRNRVVTRRTITLHVVRYAEEIERRHVAFRRARLGDEAAPVTPREFESWLLARSPDLDPALARRLVGLFEEADYGPRDATRSELVAYIEAERVVPEEVESPAVA